MQQSRTKSSLNEKGPHPKGTSDNAVVMTDRNSGNTHHHQQHQSRSGNDNNHPTQRAGDNGWNRIQGKGTRNIVTGGKSETNGQRPKGGNDDQGSNRRGNNQQRNVIAQTHGEANATSMPSSTRANNTTTAGRVFECNYCHDPGHIKRNCPVIQRKNERLQSKQIYEQKKKESGGAQRGKWDGVTSRSNRSSNHNANDSGPPRDDSKRVATVVIEKTFDEQFPLLMGGRRDGTTNQAPPKAATASPWSKKSFVSVVESETCSGEVVVSDEHQIVEGENKQGGGGDQSILSGNTKLQIL